MGRSYTPTFRVEMAVPGFVYSPSAWRSKDAGKPSDKTLSAYIAVYEKSCEPGGCNAHLGRQVVRSAKVVHQESGKTVATYSAG